MLVEVSEIYVYMIITLLLIVNQVSLKSTVLMRSITTPGSSASAQFDLSVANLYLLSTVSRYVQSRKSNVPL